MILSAQSPLAWALLPAASLPRIPPNTAGQLYRIMYQLLRAQKALDESELVQRLF
jgi:hypothetical protein